MNNPIIHIGLHKTGTTYLQNNIFPNLPEIYTLRGWQNFRELLQKKTNQKLLITDEFLSGDVFSGNYGQSFKDNMEVLQNVFNQPLIIIGFRKHSSLIFSLYKQYLHQGYYSDFNSFFNLENTGLLKVEELMYRPKIEFLQLNFSKVLIYTQEDLRNDEQKFLIVLKEFLNLEDEIKIVPSKSFSNIGIQTQLQFKFLKHLNTLQKSSFCPNLYSKSFKKLRVTPRHVAQNYLKHVPSEKFNLNTEVINRIDNFFQADWSFTNKNVTINQ